MKSISLYPLNPLLIVDDETESLHSFSMALQMHGINHMVECKDSMKVVSLLAQKPFDAILLDLTMPFVSGEEILSVVVEQFPWIPVIVVTAMDEVDTAVRCMKKGALDYMVKPVERSRLVSAVRRAIQIKELRDRSRDFKERVLAGKLQNPGAFSDIITRNKTMLAIFQYLESIASSREPVLVTGETGVGKELMVNAAHALSAPETPLVSINVAGLDDNVFSDTLFGHVKGAFTGAMEKREGLVEKAAGGILHLDEIGDLKLESQVKLLRLLQEREYFTLGSDTLRVANARLIVTTNQDLLKLQESGRFRKDLYYRLSTHHVHIPPLRNRKDDIPLLLNYFIDKAAQSFGRPCLKYPEQLVTSMIRYSFPGNVRELKTMVFDAISRNKTGTLSIKQFGDRINKAGKTTNERFSEMPSHGKWLTEEMGDRIPTLEEATRFLIKKALERCNNNQSAAARMLGISRQKLARDLKNKKS